MLDFDAEVTRILGDAYLGADLASRRKASFNALQSDPGHTIIDIGCGNGLWTADLARACPNDRPYLWRSGTPILEIAKHGADGILKTSEVS